MEAPYFVLIEMPTLSTPLDSVILAPVFLVLKHTPFKDGTQVALVSIAIEIYQKAHCDALENFQSE